MTAALLSCKATVWPCETNVTVKWIWIFLCRNNYIYLDIKRNTHRPTVPMYIHTVYPKPNPNLNLSKTISKPNPNRKQNATLIVRINLW